MVGSVHRSIIAGVNCQVFNRDSIRNSVIKFPPECGPKAAALRA